MWMEKLADGVLELDTPLGPRYVQPNFAQRAYLIWTFRNFFSLPQQVLHSWERRLIDRLLSENRFVSVSTMAGPNRPVIGRVERRVPMPAQVSAEIPAKKASGKVLSMRKPVSASTSAAGEQSQEAASA